MGLMARMRSSTLTQRAVPPHKTPTATWTREDQLKSSIEFDPATISLWTATLAAQRRRPGYGLHGHHQAGVSRQLLDVGGAASHRSLPSCQRTGQGHLVNTSSSWHAGVRHHCRQHHRLQGREPGVLPLVVHEHQRTGQMLADSGLPIIAADTWPTPRPNRRSRQVKPENTRNPIYIQQNTKVITQGITGRPVNSHMCRDYANGRESVVAGEPQTARLRSIPIFCQRERSRPGATVSVICDRRRRCRHLEPSGQPGPGDLHHKAFRSGHTRSA
jgi:hypothetical protein